MVQAVRWAYDCIVDILGYLNMIENPCSQRQSKPPSRAGALWLLAGAACLIVTTVIVGGYLREWRAPTEALWSQVSVGDSEQSVRSALGSPYREYRLESAPPEYYVSGYARRERPITGKVLIYLGADMVFYVWLDRTGYVEETFAGTS